MTDTNHPWSWPSITAGIFVGVVAGVTATLITQWIIRLNYGDTQGGHAETTVTATSTAVATATTTVTVTANSGSNGDSSDPSNSGSLPAGQQFLVNLEPSNSPKGWVETDKSPRIDGKIYHHSIRTNCSRQCVEHPSSIEYGIGSEYSTLTTTIGVDADDGDSRQIIKFNVWLIGVPGAEDKPAATEIRKAGEKKEISVPLKGASRIRLETLYGGEDPKEAKEMEVAAVWGTPILS